MNELERLQNRAAGESLPGQASARSTLDMYDQFGAMAYGIILQIIPQPHLAQEVLVNVFSSPQLQSCNSYPFSYAVCVIKLARAKAVEAKKRIAALAPVEETTGTSGVSSPEHIFDLAFRQGFTPEEVAGKLNISKSEVLRSFHEFFKSYRNA